MIRDSPHGPGRPKDVLKRELILSAAENSFFSRGFSDTTIERIAADAGVSKVTVYGHFGDKETLFEAVVTREAEQIKAAVAQLVTAKSSLEQSLIDLGEVFIGFVFSPRVINFDRLLMVEAAKNPALAKRFMAAGPHQVSRFLETIIATGVTSGELSVADLPKAAEDLAGLWLGMAKMEAQMGLLEHFTPAAISIRVRHGVTIFLHAYRSAASL
jgi:TetR/AcrR family transcriptional regulator, mexJK operon transcriptional repressor